MCHLFSSPLLILLALSPLSINATRVCPTCVPLSRLIAPSLGISLTPTTLTASIHHHNSTTIPCATLSAPAAYTSLLTAWRLTTPLLPLADPWEHAPPPPPPRALPQRLWDYFFPRALPPQELSSEAALLAPLFSEVAATCGGISNVGLSIPPYMAAHMKPVLEAATAARWEVEDIVHTVAAVAAADGRGLCRVSSEHLPCETGTYMSIDLGPEGLTAGVMSVRGNGGWIWGPQVAYRTVAGLNEGNFVNGEVERVSEWVAGLAGENKVARVYDVSRGAGMGTVYEAIKRALPGAEIVESASGLEASGAAKLTKERMEEQDQDCLEPEECERIRKEADRLVGGPSLAGGRSDGGNGGHGEL